MQRSIALFGFFAVMFISTTAFAHFPWIAKDESGKAILFFGENLADRTYKLPPGIAKAEIIQINQLGEIAKVATSKAETEKLVGLVSENSIANDQALATEATFGIYGGARLNYYCSNLNQLPKSRDIYRAMNWKSALSAQIVDTGSGIEVFVVWKDKPLEGVKVKLSCGDGHDEGDATTDANGKVTFTESQVEAGINAILVGHKTEEVGELDGKAYTKAAHYLTATFHSPKR